MEMGSTRRILIIDDNVALAKNIAEILQFDGHATDVAASAESGLRMALEHEPDVVVSDYRLPGITGAVFVEQFLRTRLHVRAVIISAHTDEETMKEATNAGAIFMAKPVDFKRLSHWVREGSA